MYQNTSREAYVDILSHIGQRQAEVLRTIIQKKEVTNTEISEYLKIPINSITPRTNELVKMGYVEEAKKRPCRITGRLSIAWKIKN